MSQQGIQIPVEAQDEFSEVFGNLQDQLGTTSTDIGDFTSSVSQLILRLRNSRPADRSASSSFSSISSDASSASAEISDYQSQLQEAQTQLQGLIETNVDSGPTFSQQAGQFATTTAVMGGLATSAISLGDSYVSLQDATLKLTNAHDNLTKAENTLKQDQDNLAAAQQHLQTLQDSGKATAGSISISTGRRDEGADYTFKSNSYGCKCPG